MRKAIYIIIGVTLLLTATACSHIDDDERLIYVRPVDVSRAVLIEDFTGQRCVNCPDAADEISRLKEQYGDETIIAVGIHSGPLAVYSTATVLGLRTAEGDEYYDHWKIDREPLGYINRSGSISTHDQWGTLVRQAVQQTATVQLSLALAYDEATRQLTINTTALGVEAAPSARLQLWLTESGITALQMMPDGSLDREYQHNHVFRASVNGTWGEDFPLAEGEQRTVTHTATVAADWQPSNLSVVAFVYGDTGVLQVTEKSLNQTISAYE